MKLNVVVICACPRLAATSIFYDIKSVAFVCLNPWKLITGSPICATYFTNHLLIVEGCIGLPSACTNNLLEFVHNSP